MAARYEQAATHMELACELNPYDSWTLLSVALYHGFCGDHTAARRLADQSLDQNLSPNLTHWAYEVSIRFMSGDYAGMLDAADRAQDCVATIPGWRAAALVQIGRRDEALHEARRFVAGVQSKWFGSGSPDIETVTRWYLNAFPIARRSDWERLRAGIAGAGLPTAGIRYDWA